MKRLLFLLIVIVRLYAYFDDEELQQLWSSIQDITQPTLSEYQLIDQYLNNGKRPYLNRLRESKQIESHFERLNRIMSFKLVGNPPIYPLYEHHLFKPNEATEERCIVLFGSANGLYPQKIRKLLQQIERSGYSGHVLVRIGGFPNTQFGGLKICHVPYAFKVAFLKEAQQLGFSEVLWMDLAIHPLRNFDLVFSEIRSKGYFFTNVGTLQDNRPTHLSQAAEELQISLDLYPQIPHISSSMIGLNLKNTQAIQLLEAWYQETEKVYPYMTWWPEELSLSVIAWRLGCTPSAWFGNLICGKGEVFHLGNRPTVQFYIDADR